MDFLTYVFPFFFVLILSYHFHVIVDDGLIYLCMADEDFGKRQPYAFLEEVTFFPSWSCFDGNLTAFLM